MVDLLGLAGGMGVKVFGSHGSSSSSSTWETRGLADGTLGALVENLGRLRLVIAEA